MGDRSGDLFRSICARRPRRRRREARGRARSVARPHASGLARALYRRDRRSAGVDRGVQSRLPAAGAAEYLGSAHVLADVGTAAAAGVDDSAGTQSETCVWRVDFLGHGGDDMAAMRWLLKRLWKTEHGAELIEFAMTFPLLLLVVMGIMDFGLLFQQYEVLTNAAREGARVAVLPGYGTTDIQTRVNQYLQGTSLSSATVRTT